MNFKGYSLKWLEEIKFEYVQSILDKTENDSNYKLYWDRVHKIESEIVKRENQEKRKKYTSGGFVSMGRRGLRY